MLAVSAAAQRGHRLVFVALLAAGSLAACGLGDKAALEERITSAPALLEGSVVSGTLTVESRLVDIPAGGVSGFGGPAVAGGGDGDFELPADGLAFSDRSVAFTLDLANDRATLRRADADAPFVLIDDLVYYGRRAGVPADDARPWVRFDLEDVPEGSGALNPLDQDRPAADAIAAVHPAVVADLVAGTLTGSIQRRGTEAVAGTDVTRYDVNVDLEKAFEDTRRQRYPEDRLEAVGSLIDSLGIDGTVHPATVWLGAEGRLRRVTLHLSQRPLRNVEFELLVTLEIDDHDGEHAVDVPEPREVLTVDSVLRFVATVAEDMPEAIDLAAAGPGSLPAPQLEAEGGEG